MVVPKIGLSATTQPPLRVLLNWFINSENPERVKNDGYDHIKITITCNSKENARRAYRGIIFLLAKDPNIEIIKHHCIAKDLFGD